MLSTPVVDADKMNTDSSDNRAEKQNQQKPPERRWGDRRLNTWFAGAVALFALVQVVVGWFQWDAMRDQARLTGQQLEQTRVDSRNTMETLKLAWLQMRPWLIVKQVSITNPLAANVPIQSTLHIVNRGSTPGSLTNAFFRLGIMVSSADPQLVVADARAQQLSIPVNNVLGPGDSAHIDVEPPTTWGEITIDAIEKGTLKLYLVARFGYKDTLGNSDVLECYRVYDPKRKQLIFVGAYDEDK